MTRKLHTDVTRVANEAKLAANYARNFFETRNRLVRSRTARLSGIFVNAKAIGNSKIIGARVTLLLSSVFYVFIQ